jgi:putative intracellular protease/amidase
MTDALNGKKIAFLTSQVGVEKAELVSPWQAVIDAGGTPTLIAPEKEPVQSMVGDVDKDDTFDPDRTVADASAADFDALVLPGGTWVDETVFHCPAGGWDLVTSRNPDDLDNFNATLTDVFAKA